MTGRDLSKWVQKPPPQMPVTRGRFVEVAPFDNDRDAAAMFQAVCGDANDDLWRHIPIGPFETAEALGAAFKGAEQMLGWRTHTIRSASSTSPSPGSPALKSDAGGMDAKTLGMASFMRVRADHGAAEVGCIVFSKTLQRTAGATEAMFLMARYIFEELGYRRYEWKCDNSNLNSRRAAVRLGFQFEGVFRQDMVVKGRNRDTAWYSITDTEWPAQEKAMTAWLHSSNIDESGRQQRSLSSFR